MKIESENFFSDVERLVKAIDASEQIPFYANGFPTNLQVLSRLKPEEQFLYQAAIGVRRGLRFDQRDELEGDPFFQDRLTRAVNSMLDEGVQLEKWAD